MAEPSYSSSTPLYYQIYTYLKDSIESNLTHSNEWLESETKLQEQFSVSRTTIRAALELLEKNNYIQRAQGKKAKIVYKKDSPFWANLLDFTNDLNVRGGSLESIVLSVKKVIPEPKIALLLRLTVHDYAYYVSRIRTIHGEKLVWTESYLPLWIKTDLTKIHFDQKTSLRKILSEEGIEFETCDETIEVTEANLAVVKLLDLDDGNRGTIRRERVSFDQFRRPIEYVVSHHNPKFCKYYVRNKKVKE